MSNTTDFGFSQVDENAKARQSRRRIPFRCEPLRRDERFHVCRITPRVEALHCSPRSAEAQRKIIGSGRRQWRSGQAIFQSVGAQSEMWLTDINASMLKVGRDRLTNEGILCPALLCDAEELPFPSNYFDVVTCAFGLRNMTHKDRALGEMQRVLRPGGRAIVLEFSKVWEPLKPAYDAYSFNVLPVLGKYVARDEASYRYLAESIRMHPDQETLKTMMGEAGLARAEYFNLSAGVVAVHRGFKF